MYIIDRKLKEREVNNNPIRIGIIGCGEMGRGLINHIYRYIKGMEITAVYNRTPAKSELAMDTAGITKYRVTNNPMEFNQAIESGQVAITSEPDLLIESPYLDVLVEITGQIMFGLEMTLKAFSAGKHVVSFNAELESTFGPLIKAKAEENNVKYTLGDGDQPGVTLNLYRYVKAMGFSPLVCGNIKGMQDRYRTPATQAAFAKKWGISAIMATNFADGTKIAFEQACTANATNMAVAERGMTGYPYDGHVDDLTGKFDVDKLKSLGGIVDYALGSKPGPGVFVFASAEDPFSVQYLSYGKLGNGPLYSFYVPYHLLFFELAFSIVRLIDFDDVTLDAAYGMKVEVGTFAKQDLKAGIKLDGIGGFHTYGMCENYREAKNGQILPMGLSENAALIKDIKKDQPITFNDVEFPKNDVLLNYYYGQTKLLIQKHEMYAT
jgi:predicted homoserine dehydrogenase-like protein